MNSPVLIQAAITSLAAGALAAAVLMLASRLSPAIAVRRRYWLGAQALVLAATLGAFIPRTAETTIVPVIELAEPEHAHSTDAAPSALVVAEVKAQPFLLAGEWLVLLYGAGLAYLLARRLRGHSMLRRVVGEGMIVHRLGRVTVVDVAPDVPAMAAGVVEPVVVLPAGLDGRHLVRRHEFMHLRRRDPLWLMLSRAMTAVLWFNPALHWMAGRLVWAQEFGCDAAVLRGRSNAQRKSYAMALMAQLRRQQENTMPAMAFGVPGMSALTARLVLIRDGALPVMGKAAGVMVATGLSTVLIGSIVFQPAFARRAAEVAEAPGPAYWIHPMEQPRISSLYGDKSPKRKVAHRGVDFAAPTGTRVQACSDGTVVESTDLFRGQAKYGKVVVVDHGGGIQTMYAHLDARSVKVGDKVAAGQMIGAAGETGIVTGPHLHFEMWRNGKQINPDAMLPDLDNYASKTALARIRKIRS
jgi:murein DD-endopeptidase MepM/ murein hydrolase activator NlpD